jgi:hypothetical protein
MRYLLYLLLCCATTLNAQEAPTLLEYKINKTRKLDRDPNTEKAIQQLKEKGILVVRLPSKSKKIEAIDAEIKQFENDAKYVARLEKMKYKTQVDLQKFNERVSGALNAFYDFSEIYYMYDTAVVSLVNGKRSGFLLDKNLVKQPNLTLKDKHFLILKCEKLSNSPGASINGFVVADEQNENLEYPFPAVIPFNVLIARGKYSKANDKNTDQLKYWATLPAVSGGDFSQFVGKLPSKKKMKRAVDSLNNSFHNYAQKTAEKPSIKD